MDYVVKGERIIFGEGVSTKAIKPFCKECKLNIACLGPDSKGFADLSLPKDVSNPEEYITANANCLKENV